ncbi:MAG: preprotein translocase subunit SecA [Planctomycetes bacterium]|nr:preprotein translocase subunit SecA [Planctomycetota bacterium]
MKLDIGSLPARVGKGLQKIFGSANQRAVNSYQPRVQAINERAGWAESLDADGVRAAVAEWRRKVQAEEATLEDALVDIFALTRVASERTIGLRHFDVQLVGGMVLHDGKIAEMATGEGKTLVATLAAALNALSGRGVYVVTVNDYLAKRDRDWMAPIYEYLGLTVGAIQASMGPRERKPQYACDILYGTNNEFGFDYLRDNMKQSPAEQVQKRLNYAIIDEVDSILIDEARTPLIISGPPEGKASKWLMADRIARQLRETEHFEVKLKEQQVLLTDAGTERAEELAGVGSFYSDPANMDWPHMIEQSLRAHHIYKRDTHYVVARSPRTGRNEVTIVDEFTGRLMTGRRWSDGLHQAVEAKEGMKPQEESQVLATITLQNYFRMFDKLAGMTGTAMTEAAEFSKIYDLDVVAIPTNRPMVRKDQQDLIYLDEDDKYRAIVERIGEEHAKERPMLVGTVSIEKSEKLSKLLQTAGIPHEVLNAKHHAREAEIVAQAGRKGAVTVATNMAGRGTDIVLGGNPEKVWELECGRRELERDTDEAKALREELRRSSKADGERIKELGGLLVIGTERHEARRIDNQLRGRCGRQGDPGESIFFLSFDDDLMKIFARDWVKTMMEKLGLRAGERIESPMVSRGIANAQKKVEQRNFDIRKNLIEYDEVMDAQRKFIYTQRQEVLEEVMLREKVVGMFEEVLEPIVEQHSGDKNEPVAWQPIREWVEHKCGDQIDLSDLESTPRESILDELVTRFERGLDARRDKYGEDDWRRVLQFLLLDTIDQKWKDHLHAMEVLKAGIGLRGYAQVDPKNEYKKEGYEKFRLLKSAIADQVTNLVFRVELRRQDVDAQQAPGARGPVGGVPTDPVAIQAWLEAMHAAGQLDALVAAGHVPAQIAEALKRGEKITIRSRADVEREQREAAQRKAEEERRQQAERAQAAATAAAVAEARVGRNDPCPCGSGKKYKKCHGAH